LATADEVIQRVQRGGLAARDLNAAPVQLRCDGPQAASAGASGLCEDGGKVPAASPVLWLMTWPRVTSLTV
jgi:hypothetical protein